MKKIISIIALLFVITINAQTVNIPKNSTKVVMYVEFGGKGIKLGVLAYTDAAYRRYLPVENKELNVGLSKNFQSTGKISATDIASAVSSSYDSYNDLLEKYKSYGLEDKNVFFYTSSGVGVAKNVDELCEAVKAKTGHGVYVVKETEEAKYTIAGTIPYDKIDNALVLDQGGSNTKGGYIVKEGNSLTAIPTNFDLGSVRVTELIIKYYMSSHPDDKDQERQAFIAGMNKCFDSLKVEIKNSFSNIDGSESRNELYLSGGAAFVITTLLYPDASLSDQMIPINLDKLKAFLTDIQDRDFYKTLQAKQISDEKKQKAFNSALKIYSQLQLISATKLLVTYINALSGDEKKIYFNRYGLHSMPSILIGRVLRGEIKRW